MPPVLARLVARMQSTLSGISVGQRVVAGLLAAGLVLGGVFFVSWATQPTYAPLFSNLASTDASAIVEELNAEGVTYELADGGGTVMVPKDQVYNLRLSLSGKGLPAGEATGYSLLDKQGITTSEFQQQTQYQRAIEGELADTLEAMDGVKTATVHLAIPKKDVFADEESKPTASVLVALKPGARLGATQVQAITHLVASSVEGMAPEDVTLADSDKNLYAAAGKEGMVGAAGDAQSQMQADVQDRLAEQAREVLIPIAGQGKAVVKVSADLDFDVRGTTSETYTYTKGVPPLSESSSKEDYTGSGNQVGGILGPDNPDGRNTTAGGDGKYAKESSTKNNAVNKSVESVKAAPGQVKRLTVSVLMDEKAMAGADRQAEIEALVQNAVGFNADRGDTLTVAAMPFDTSDEEQAKKDLAQAEKDKQREEMIGYAKIGAAALLGLIVLIVLLVALRKRKKPAAEPVVLSDEQQSELNRIREEIAARESVDLDAMYDVEGQRREKIRAEIAELIDTQPEEVAAMVRGWLGEDKA